MALELPAYSPSLDAPSYSRQPLANERSLEYRSRIGYQQPVDIPVGVYKRKTKQVTLALFNQNENATIPIYGPHLQVVSGELAVLSHEKVTSVVLKLQGRMTVILGKLEDSPMTSTNILGTKEILYDRDKSQFPFPENLIFSALLPSSYLNGSQTWYLPPTFLTPTEGKFKTHVQIDYSMMFEITMRTRAHILSKVKPVYIPFRYEIRDRPRYPYLPNRSPLSSLKTTPEEWEIKTFTIVVREGGLRSMSPIKCQMIIPSTSAFGLVDFIPFHIEFFGTVASLKHFFGKPGDPQDTGIRIRLSLMRQVSVKTTRQEATRSILLGKAEIRPLPPPPSFNPFNDWATVDYEGELKVDPGMKEIRTGGFVSSGVSVQDCIELTLTPRSPDTSSFDWCTYTYPINLVTDSWYADLEQIS